jgi:alpha-beta hydrolase superfamily lysophospholipase
MLLQIAAASYLVLGAAALCWVAGRAVYDAIVSRRPRADAIWAPPPNPVAVATLMHGTWARSASWTRGDSPLGSALRAAFDERLALFRFDWTGQNRVRERERAARRLQAHLLALLARYPDARHYVIAHSHAGNIVMYALRDAALAGRLHGVVCLSTPFLHVRRRHLGAITNAAIVAAVVVTSWILVVTGLEWLTVEEDAAILSGLIAAALIGYGLATGSRRESERLLRLLALPDTLATPCLIIRASGDEAGAALGMVRFLSWLVGVCWIAPAGVAAEVVAVVKGWGETARRYAWPAAFSAAGGAAVLLLDRQAGPFLTDTPGLRAVAETAGGAALTAGVATLLVWWLGSGAGVYGYVLGFAAAGVVVSPLVLLLAILIAPFGPDLVLGSVHLDITAEATPPGAWTVHHLRGAPTVGERHEPGAEGASGLMHGTHASPEAIRLLVDWLREKVC